MGEAQRPASDGDGRVGPPTTVLPPIPPWGIKFLQSLRKCGSPSYAARTAKTTTRNVRRLKARHPEFKARVAEAKRQAAALLEREAWRRALDGLDETTVLKRRNRDGDMVVVEEKTRRVFSDQLLKTLLQAHFPGKYADKKQVETTIKDDTAISRAQLREMLKSPRKRELLAQLAEPDPPPGADQPARAGFRAPLALEQTADLANSGKKPVLTEPLGGDEAGIKAEPGNQVDGPGQGGASLAGAPLGDGGGPDA